MSSGDPAPIERPVIHSARLRADPVRAEDAVAMAGVLSPPEIHAFLDGEPPTVEPLQRQYRFLEGGSSPDGREAWLTWIVRRRPDASTLPADAEPAEAPPIGFIQATVREPHRATAAWVLHPDHWRRGYAREIVTAMLDVIVARYDVGDIVAEMQVGNAASIRLAEAMGMRRIDTVTLPVEPPGSPVQEHVYAISRAEWTARRAADAAP